MAAAAEPRPRRRKLPPSLLVHGGLNCCRRNSCGEWTRDDGRNLQRVQRGAVQVQVPLLPHALVSPCPPTYRDTRVRGDLGVVARRVRGRIAPATIPTGFRDVGIMVYTSYPGYCGTLVLFVEGHGVTFRRWGENQGKRIG